MSFTEYMCACCAEPTDAQLDDPEGFNCRKCGCVTLEVVQPPRSQEN